MQSKFDSLGRQNIQLSGITDAVSGWDGETDRGYVNVNDCANRRRSISIYSRIPGYVAQDRYAVWPLREIHYSTVLRRHYCVRLGRCNSLASRFHIGETWARKRVNVRNSISDDITAIALRHAWRAAKCTSALTLFLPFPFFFFDHERTRRILMAKSFFRHYRKRRSYRKWAKMRMSAAFVYRHACLDSAHAVLIAPIVEYEHRKASENAWAHLYLSNLIGIFF